MNVRDYSTLHLDSNEKQVATLVLLLHEHLTLWNQYSVILVFIMPISHNMHSVVRHYRIVRRVLRYQRFNQNPHIEEGHITQWPQEKRTKGQTTLYNTYI